ncbi:hypothetical protein GCM10009733_104100 [Nonomuraea maheshkhaliensis]|uniref:MFS transporter n=1 Tax=Nonomuraea maheshkhaliensis TaxID=419590 RepID=A0ABP4TNA0_9ACTN
MSGAARGKNAYDARVPISAAAIVTDVTIVLVDGLLMTPILYISAYGGVIGGAHPG